MKIKAISLFFALVFAASVICSSVFSISAKNDINELEVSIDQNAGAVYLYNYDSDRVLVSRSSEVKMAPSATAKMMSGLLVCQNYVSELDRSVTITEDMLKGLEGNSMGLEVGMIVTVRDLLYGTVCGCNNDAAQALAIACAGSVREFVKEMNILADRLYMKNTVYKNPTGLDADGAVTTLDDTARLAQKASQNKIYMTVSSVPSFDFAPQNANVRTVYNRNALISQFTAAGYINKYAKGLIAGSSDGSYVLATYVQKDEVSYLCVIMGAASDGNTIYSYETANALLDRAFRKYQLIKIAKLGDSFLSEDVGLTVGSDDDSLKAVCVVPKDVYAFVNQDVDPKKDITYKAYLHENAMRAPLSAGEVVGGVDFYYNGAIVASSTLVVEDDVDANIILAVMHTVKEFFFSRVFLIGFVLSVVFVSLYLYVDSKNKRHKKVGRVTFKKFS